MEILLVSILGTLVFYLLSSMFLDYQCRYRCTELQIEKNIGKTRKLMQFNYVFLWVFNTIVTGFMLGLVWLLSLMDIGLYKSEDYSVMSISIIFLQMIWVLFLLDTNFYWLHRWVHSNKILLKIVHKEHHKAVHPVVWDSQFLGPLDHLFTIALPLLVVAILPIPVSIEAYVLALVSSQFTNIAGHCGFELSQKWFGIFSLNGIVARLDANRVWIGRLFNLTCHHDLHHKSPGVNYSLYFTFWDLVCGTASHDGGTQIIQESSVAAYKLIGSK